MTLLTDQLVHCLLPLGDPAKSPLALYPVRLEVIPNPLKQRMTQKQTVQGVFPLAAPQTNPEGFIRVINHVEGRRGRSANGADSLAATLQLFRLIFDWPSVRAD